MREFEDPVAKLIFLQAAWDTFFDRARTAGSEWEKKSRSSGEMLRVGKEVAQLRGNATHIMCRGRGQQMSSPGLVLGSAPSHYHGGGGGGHSKYQVGPTVYTKTNIFTYFYCYEGP